jgi:hypothetical protein
MLKGHNSIMVIAIAFSTLPILVFSYTTSRRFKVLTYYSSLGVKAFTYYSETQVPQ